MRNLARTSLAIYESPLMLSVIAIRSTSGHRPVAGMRNRRIGKQTRPSWVSSY